MNELIILASALLPAVVLWVYVWRQDPQPEPPGWLRRGVLYGMAICLVVPFIEMAVMAALFGSGGEPTTLVGTTLEAFLVAALPEEGFKLLALWLLLRRNPNFDEHYDGIVYAVCVGLGFAAVENVGYLFSYVDDWQTTAIARAFLAVPAHYAFAVLMGYYYSIYHFTDRSPRTRVCILLVPVLAHGVYDAIAMGGAVSDVVGAASSLVLIFFCFKMHKHVRRKMLAHIERDRHRA